MGRAVEQIILIACTVDGPPAGGKQSTKAYFDGPDARRGGLMES